jgi:hypothetical protein
MGEFACQRDLVTTQIEKFKLPENVGKGYSLLVV